MKDSEIWAPVKGFEHDYEVSSIGRVRRKDGEILNPGIHNRGYRRVNFKGKSWFIHRLVAQAFIPNPEEKPQVNHINGVRDDNRAENLEWVTCQENLRHSYDVLGTPGHNLGKRSPRRKLTDEQARDVKYSKKTYSQLCEQYGIDDSTIHAIRHGKQYRDIA